MELPYMRVAGEGCSWSETVHGCVDSVLAAEAADEAAASAAAAAVRRAGAGAAPVPPPAAVSTHSARELHALRRMNVSDRYAPAERFAEPLTAAQETGWRVGAEATAAANVGGARASPNTAMRVRA